MRLAIMIALYCGAIAVSLGILYGPLRRTIDPKKEHRGRIVIPLLLLAAIYSFSLIGALVPDGPLCWFFQHWGNIFLGYGLYFFGPLVFIWIILLVYRIIYRISHHEKWQPYHILSIKAPFAAWSNMK